MAKKTRDIGAEILQGLREIKRGETGRVINVADVAATRKKSDCPKHAFGRNAKQVTGNAASPKRKARTSQISTGTDEVRPCFALRTRQTILIFLPLLA